MKDFFLALDFETTGLSSDARPTELGAHLIDVKGKELGEWESLINPQGKKISSEAFKITGITDEMVANAPSPQEVGERFSKWIRELSARLGEGSRIHVVGHHVGKADMPYLQEMLGDDYGKLFSGQVIDTMDVAARHQRYRFSKGLGALFERFGMQEVSGGLGVSEEIAHRGLPDARATNRAFVKMARDMGVGLESFIRSSAPRVGNVATKMKGLSPKGFLLGAAIAVGAAALLRRGREDPVANPNYPGIRQSYPVHSGEFEAMKPHSEVGFPGGRAQYWALGGGMGGLESMDSESFLRRLDVRIPGQKDWNRLIDRVGTSKRDRVRLGSSGGFAYEAGRGRVGTVINPSYTASFKKTGRLGIEGRLIAVHEASEKLYMKLRPNAKAIPIIDHQHLGVIANEARYATAAGPKTREAFVRHGRDELRSVNRLIREGGMAPEVQKKVGRYAKGLGKILQTVEGGYTYSRIPEGVGSPRMETLQPAQIRAGTSPRHAPPKRPVSSISIGSPSSQSYDSVRSIPRRPRAEMSLSSFGGRPTTLNTPVSRRPRMPGLNLPEWPAGEMLNPSPRPVPKAIKIPSISPPNVMVEPAISEVVNEIIEERAAQAAPPIAPVVDTVVPKASSSVDNIAKKAASSADDVAGKMFHMPKAGGWGMAAAAAGIIGVGAAAYGVLSKSEERQRQYRSTRMARGVPSSLAMGGGFRQRGSKIRSQQGRVLGLESSYGIRSSKAGPGEWEAMKPHSEIGFPGGRAQFWQMFHHGKGFNPWLSSTEQLLKEVGAVVISNKATPLGGTVAGQVLKKGTPEAVAASPFGATQDILGITEAAVRSGQADQTAIHEASEMIFEKITPLTQKHHMPLSGHHSIGVIANEARYISGLSPTKRKQWVVNMASESSRLRRDADDYLEFVLGEGGLTPHDHRVVDKTRRMADRVDKISGVVEKGYRMDEALPVLDPLPILEPVSSSPFGSLSSDMSAFFTQTSRRTNQRTQAFLSQGVGYRAQGSKIRSQQSRVLGLQSSYPSGPMRSRRERVGRL